jgi:regulatory factor X
LCTSALVTSALREISLAGGAGFGAWWVLRCWIDEWVGWCAELGGFIGTTEGDDSKPAEEDAPPLSEESYKKRNASRLNGSNAETSGKNGGSVDLMFGSFISSADNKPKIEVE